jgi:hypothetical protein
MATLAPQYFSTLSHKGYNFRKKSVTKYIMRVLIFFTAFLPVFLSDFDDRYSKKKKNSNINFYQDPSSECRVVSGGRTDRQIDRRTDGRKDRGTL